MKPSKSTVRKIVCDALSGITNPIPAVPASDGIVIGQALNDAANVNPNSIHGYYEYLRDELIEAGATQVWFGPDILRFASASMTIGDLVGKVHANIV